MRSRTVTREPYSRDPRNVAGKAETYLAATGVADTAYFGPEAEFYIFDSVEGWWNTGRDEPGGNRGYKTAYKGGYFPVPPVDHFAGFAVEKAHHEVGTRRPG